MALYLPMDEVTGPSIDADRAADFLELNAFMATDSSVTTSELAGTAAVGAAEDHDDVDSEMQEGREDLVRETVDRIDSRLAALGGAYPFALDAGGGVLTCGVEEPSFGQAAYLLSLVLSNLRAVTPVLDHSGIHPDDAEVRRLRAHFQCCATVALAAELQGDAWWFGSPRPDGSSFLDKLDEIWGRFGDGVVSARIGAPQQPKDDQVDVFAARTHLDGLPGFLLAAAQVATGVNWREKSLKAHLQAFRSRWFSTQPTTCFIPYMIVPFATDDRRFMDDVRVMGNVLHRLRVPRRVAEAAQLAEAGGQIEGYDRLPEVARWVGDYRNRARAAV